jgi:hypothetical protein
MTHFGFSFRQAGARVAFALIGGGLFSVACSNSNSSPGPIDLGTGGTDAAAGSGGTAASSGGSGASSGGKSGSSGASSGGAGGSSGAATGGKDGGNIDGGSTGGASDGGPADSGAPPCTLGEGDGGCIRCPPKSTDDFLNQCTSSTCYPFDDAARLPRYNNGSLPTLQ